MINESRKKMDLENGNYFVDYFYCLGLDHDLIFSDFLYTNDIKTLNESIKIRPVVITKFPNVNKSIIKFDEESILKVSLYIIFSIASQMVLA